MRWPWQRTQVITSYESEPYAFEPGMRYVVEVDSRAITMQQVRELDDFFQREGIIVKLVVNNKGIRAIHPIESTKQKEYTK